MTHFTHDYEQGITDERDRILRLLEELSGQTVSNGLIALIKGEGK